MVFICDEFLVLFEGLWLFKIGKYGDFFILFVGLWFFIISGLRVDLKECFMSVLVVMFFILGEIIKLFGIGWFFIFVGSRIYFFFILVMFCGWDEFFEVLYNFLFFVLGGCNWVLEVKVVGILVMLLFLEVEYVLLVIFILRRFWLLLLLLEFRERLV